MNKLGQLWPVALFALVFVLLGDVALANAPQETYGWPYFGPDPAAASMIQGSFIAQASLMGAFSSGAGGGGGQITGEAPLQVIGALAAVVGGIFIFFRRKLWSPSVLGAWLVTVIIVIFVPVQSKLLFTALLPFQPTQNALLDRVTTVGASDKTYYAFTPQVAAVDLASRAQLIVNGMFNDLNFRDLKQEILSMQQLKNNGHLDAGHAWVKSMQDYSRQCNMSVHDIYKTTEKSAENAAKVAALRSTRTFADYIQRLSDFYGAAELSQVKSAPPIALFYHEGVADQMPAEMNAYKVKMATFVQVWHNALLGKKIEVEWNYQPSGKKSNGETDKLSVQNALIDIFINQNTSNDKSWIGSGFNSNPAHFFQPSELRNSQGQEIQSLMPVGGYDNNYINSDFLRGYYMASTGLPNFDISLSNSYKKGLEKLSHLMWSLNQSESFLKNIPSAHREDFEKKVSRYEPSIANNAWRAFMQAAETESVDIFSMPVAIFTLTKTKGVHGENASTVESHFDCEQKGRELIDQSFRLTFGNAKGYDFSKLYNTVFNLGAEASLPNGATSFKFSDLVQDASDPGILDFFTKKKEWQDTGIHLTKVLNRKLADFNNLPPELQNNEKFKRGELLVELLRIIHGVTLNTNNISNMSQAEFDAFTNSNTVGVVTNEALTSFGGRLAAGLGRVLLGVGAFFTGPTAQAYVIFLDYLVQMAIMALIVITPFMLLAGVLMPGAAAGVLAVSVMAAFVLQFLPVTMIILNSLGGLIYQLVGATNAEGSWTMQHMLVMGMSTLYTSIVGLTLYLMFKMGDPAAAMGALQGLDKAAKQAADVGVKAAKTLALAVAGGALTLGGGALAGMAGAGKVAGMMKAAGARLGGGEIAGAVNAMMNTPEPKAREDETATQDNKINEGRTRDEEVLSHIMGEDERKAAEKALGVGRKYLEDSALNPSHGIHNEKFLHPVNLGEVDGKPVIADLDRNGDIKNLSIGGELMKLGAPATPPAAQTAPAAPVAPSTSGGVNGEKSADAGSDKGPDKAEDSANKPEGGDLPETAGTMQSGGASPATAASPGKQEVPAARQPTLKEKAAQRDRDAVRARLEEEYYSTRERLKLLEGKGAADEKHAEHGNYLKVKAHLEDLEKMEKDLDKFDNNYNPDIASLGDEMLKFEAMSRNLDLANARFGADLAPTKWQGFKSGFIGAGKGLLSGTGSIPVIGGVLKEVINEYKEAPERVKAWNAAGGYKEYKQAVSDAERLGHYQKAVSPLAGGFQYKQMVEVGGFQAVPDMAKFQIAQSVAGSRSMYEQLLQHSIDTKKVNVDLNTNNVQMKFDAADFAGIGKVAAAQNIGSVWGEVASMQTTKYKVKVWNDAKKEFETQEVRPNNAALSSVYKQLGIKSAGKFFDAAMTDYVGIINKTFTREAKEWKATRGMANNLEAAGRFIAEDTDLDYVVTGQLKMREGKNKFARMQGELEGWRIKELEQTKLIRERPYMNPAAVMKIVEKDSQNGMYNGVKVSDLRYALSDISVKGKTAATLKQVIQPGIQKALLKAAEASIDKIDMPATGVFEASKLQGKYDILTRSAVAKYQVAVLDDKLADEVASARAKMLNSTNLNASTQKDIGFEVNNIKYKLNAGTKEFSGKAERAGSKYADIIVKEFFDLLKSSDKEFAKNAIKSRTKEIWSANKNGTKGTLVGKQAYHEISQEARKRLEDVLRKKYGDDAVQAFAKVFIDGSNKFARLQVHKKDPSRNKDE